MTAWTADATHFTADATDHTADGYHDHGEDDVGGGGKGAGRKRYKGPRYNVAQLRREDDLLLDMIRQFMDRVH